MSDRELIDCVEMREIDVTEDTLDSAIFHFLDEILFLYGSEYFMTNRVDIKICSRAVSAADGTELQELFDIPDDSQGMYVRVYVCGTCAGVCMCMRVLDLHVFLCMLCVHVCMCV